MNPHKKNPISAIRLHRMQIDPCSLAHVGTYRHTIRIFGNLGTKMLKRIHSLGFYSVAEFIVWPNDNSLGRSSAMRLLKSTVSTVAVTVISVNWF